MSFISSLRWMAYRENLQDSVMLTHTLWIHRWYWAMNGAYILYYKVKSSTVMSSTISKTRVRGRKLKRLTVINFKSRRSLRVRSFYRTFSYTCVRLCCRKLNASKTDFEDHVKRMSGLARLARSAVIDDRYPARKPRHELGVYRFTLSFSAIARTRNIFTASCMKNSKSDFDSFIKSPLHRRKALHPYYLVNAQ